MSGNSEIKRRGEVSSRESRSRLAFEVLESIEGRLEGLVLLAQAAHDESRLSYITFAPHKVEAIVRKGLVDTKRHGIMLCTDRERLVGAVYCSIGEYHVGEGTLVTTIHNINVLPERRRGLSGGKVALGLLRGVVACIVGAIRFFETKTL